MQIQQKYNKASHISTLSTVICSHNTTQQHKLNTVVKAPTFSVKVTKQKPQH